LSARASLREKKNYMTSTNMTQTLIFIYKLHIIETDSYIYNYSIAHLTHTKHKGNHLTNAIANQGAHI